MSTPLIPQSSSSEAVMKTQSSSRHGAGRNLLHLLALLVAASAVFLAPASVSASGRTLHMSPGQMTRIAFLMRANVDYEITVESDDAIVTIVTYPEGNFVAGSADATFGFIVPHTSTARNVF